MKYCEVKEKILSNADFQKYPCVTREDFFDYMMEYGLDRETAYTFSEIIRKGGSRREYDFHTLAIPQELKNVAMMYQYVFPRGQGIEYILFYARMAYYMKWDSRVYNSVLSKNIGCFVY